MHDLARHATHATETLEIASDLFEVIEEKLDALKLETAASSHHSNASEVCLLVSLVRSLHKRSIANEKRLQNEINLVCWNNGKLTSTNLMRGV